MGLFVDDDDDGVESDRLLCSFSGPVSSTEMKKIPHVG